MRKKRAKEFQRHDTNIVIKQRRGVHGLFQLQEAKLEAAIKVVATSEL